MAGLGDIALELKALPDIIVEKHALAGGVEVTRQEDARAAVVEPQQQTVAIRILAWR
jgi:hypothetical protein